MELHRDNVEIAGIFERAADLLEFQSNGASRSAAYRNAARTIRSLERSPREIFRLEGIGGLESLPFVGMYIASAIVEILETHKLRLVEQLEGDDGRAALLRTVPGIGAELARRIHRQLGIETLEELSLAAHDGRLERVEGFGPRRAQTMREMLASMLTGSVHGPRLARAIQSQRSTVRDQLAFRFVSSKTRARKARVKRAS